MNKENINENIHQRSNSRTKSTINESIVSKAKTKLKNLQGNKRSNQRLVRLEKVLKINFLKTVYRCIKICQKWSTKIKPTLRCISDTLYIDD